MKTKVAITIIGLILLVVFFFVQTNRKSIDIDKTNHVLTACETRSRCFTLPITTGSKESPTKNGHFKVLNKIENVQSYHGYVFPLWLGAYEVGAYENGIHSVQGDNPWTDDIGKDNTTAGSIILSVEDMQRLYDFAEVGTLIYIHN